MQRGNGQGRGLGRGMGQSRRQDRNLAGPSGLCICPSCGHKEQHIQGVPCMDKTCPKCGSKMIRE